MKENILPIAVHHTARHITAGFALAIAVALLAPPARAIPLVNLETTARFAPEADARFHSALDLFPGGVALDDTGCGVAFINSAGFYDATWPAAATAALGRSGKVRRTYTAESGSGGVHHSGGTASAVPDGGSTLLLLGSGLGILFAVSRRPFSPLNRLAGRST